MKITNPLLTKSLGLFGATMIRALTATLDYRIVYEDPLADPIHPRRPRHAIYLLWHEYLIFPLGLRGKGMTALISQHRDGELITQVMRHLGFVTARGSSTRGGVPALRRMLKGREIRKTGTGGNRENREGSSVSVSSVASCSNVSDFGFRISDLIVTPDGPRGPRRRLAEGSIFLASRLQMPIVCMGFAFERPWRQKSWDRFAIPRPFSRGRAVISHFIEIPANLSKDEGGRMKDEQNQESGVRDQESAVSASCLTPDSCRLTPGSDSSFIPHPSSIEYWRLQVEQILNQVTGEAESWAESGRRKPGEMPILRHQPAPQMTRPAA